MGELRLIIDKRKLNTPEYSAAIAAFLGGTLIHLFGLVTVIHNSDDIHCHPIGYGTGVTSGRWLLTILGDLLKKNDLNYNLGFFNGLAFIGLLAISAGILVSIFRIKHRQSAALIGLILVSFPTVCSTLLYKYTSALYGIAFLFSVFAVWVLPRYKIGGFLLSAFAIACSLGIYQAYLPVTAAVYVLWLYQVNLSEDISFTKLFRKGLYALGSMIFGLAIYFVITEISLDYYGKVLNEYQGINEMGKIHLAELPGLIGNTYRRYFRLPFDNYCDLATNKILKAVYLLIYLFNIVLSVLVLVTKKKGLGNVIMAILLGSVFPIAVNLIEIMCPNSRIYTLMVFSCVASAFVPVVLLDQLNTPPKVIAKPVIAVLLLFVILNTYFNNLTYTSLYYVTRQTENYLNSMVTQIRMTEDFSVDKKWAFIGKNEDPMVNNKWQSVPVYGGAEHTNRMLSAYSWKEWIPPYLGISIPMADNATIDAIKQTPEFQEMSCWPNDNSIKIIDEIIVIKFQQE